LSFIRGVRILCVQVKLVDTQKKAVGEDKHLNKNWHWGTKARVSKRIRDPCSSSSKRCVLLVK